MAEGLVTYTRLDDPEDIIVNTQGRAISPDDEILVLDDDDNPAPEGESDHLLTRGPYTIRACHDDPGANARSFTEDDFYRTGDHIDRAGEKISAEEVEDNLLAHPGIFDAAVVSIPVAFPGERSRAFVILQPGTAQRAQLRVRFLDEGKTP